MRTGIYVCELVPPLTLDDLANGVKKFNDKFKELSSNNGISII